MCPMLLNNFDGPAMVLSPPQEHAFLQFPRQPVLDSASSAGSRSFFANGIHTQPFSSGTNHSFSTSLSSTVSHARPSRKRSRDDVASEESTRVAPTLTAPVPAPREESIYGGTWYEEAAENNITATPSISRSHSSEVSRKFQRLDPSASRLDDSALSSIQRQLQDNDKEDNRRILSATSRSNPFVPEEPQVDDATRLLGISWQRIQSDDADMAAAIRGWKKYIDRQFSAYLVDSDILMKNRALNAYLVSARPVTPMGPTNNPMFYLFNEELTQGQLVGSTWETCLRNLQSTPIMFEGRQVLCASDKPTAPQNDNVLAANPVDAGLPLLQTLCTQPTPNLMLNTGMGQGTGMEIDS